MDTPQREPRFLVTEYQFDDMHLRVGDRFQLESHANPVQRHYGTLVGYSAGQSVLVKTPFINGLLPVPYTDGQALTARAFTGVGVFAFDTAVQRVCVSPFHYLHLDFPSEVRGVQIRTTERVKVTMPTQATIAGMQVPGVITDIGIGGAMLECDRKLHAGDPLKVYVTFSLEQMQIKAGFEAEATVHRRFDSTQPDQATPLHCYGLEFENITLGQRVMLQNFVYHQLLQDHQLLI